MTGHLVPAVRKGPDEVCEHFDCSRDDDLTCRGASAGGLGVELGQLGFPTCFFGVGPRDDPVAGECLRDCQWPGYLCLDR